MSERDGDRPDPNTELARLQRRMQAVVTRHASSVGAGEAVAQGDAGGDPGSFAELVAPSATLSGAQRLDIYARSYSARLLQCFQTMFPSLRQALGAELFDHFALDYLQRHPPRSYTLDHLADDFPQHLAETRPDADAPPSERESWPDFIIELAALECAFLKVYDGEGVEGRRLPAERDIHALSDAQLLRSTPAPVPCLRLFAFRYPVHLYLLATRRGQATKATKLPAPARSFVALARRDYRVVMRELSPAQHALLKAFDGSQTLSQTLAQLALSGAHYRLNSPAVARHALCHFAAQGFLESLSNGGEAGASTRGFQS